MKSKSWELGLLGGASGIGRALATMLASNRQDSKPIIWGHSVGSCETRAVKDTLRTESKLSSQTEISKAPRQPPRHLASLYRPSKSTRQTGTLRQRRLSQLSALSEGLTTSFLWRAFLSSPGCPMCETRLSSRSQILRRLTWTQPGRRFTRQHWASSSFIASSRANMVSVVKVSEDFDAMSFLELSWGTDRKSPHSRDCVSTRLRNSKYLKLQFSPRPHRTSDLVSQRHRWSGALYGRHPTWAEDHPQRNLPWDRENRHLRRRLLRQNRKSCALAEDYEFGKKFYAIAEQLYAKVSFENASLAPGFLYTSLCNDQSSNADWRFLHLSTGSRQASPFRGKTRWSRGCHSGTARTGGWEGQRRKACVFDQL